MIPKPETEYQAIQLAWAIRKQLLPADRPIWAEEWVLVQFRNGALHEKLKRFWEEEWTEDQCRQILTEYVARRLTR